MSLIKIEIYFPYFLVVWFSIAHQPQGSEILGLNVNVAGQLVLIK